MTALVMVLMTDEEVAGLGRNSDAGFGALQTSRGLLPLVGMDVDARVAGVMAAVDVAQTFVNTTGTAIEATYIFPLPDRAAVHRFRMEVAGRVVEGIVEERGAAREQYDRAIQAGHRAAITEEERGGVFTLRVGNLMPGESAKVVLSLVGPLPVDDGEVTFRFPLVVAPRYMPGTALGGDQAGLGTASDTDLVPDASRISPPVLLPGCPNPVRLGLRVALEDHTVREVISSLHAITTSRRDAQVVEVQPGERLDRDFILRWRVDDKQLRSQLVCADDADGKAGTFMLTLVPPSTTSVAAKPRDVVFVIDRSGSMEGWKMVAARRAAARMIDTLTSRDRFCALAFDDSVEALPENGLVDGTDRNRYRAVEALAKIESRGGTEMAEPLRHAVAMLAGGHDNRERVVVLVTDGQVGNEDHILRELAHNIRNVRMFALGIDQAVNAAFLRRLASTGGGLCELVESEDRLDAVMAKVHRRIGTPIATELALRPSGLDLAYDQIAPKKLPDVYAGAPVTILGRYRGRAPAGATIDVEGTSLGDPLRMQIARTASADPAAWLAASWARSAIRDREDQYAAGERGNLEREIVSLSKQFNVLSRFTAFLAIDRAAVVNPGGNLREVVQPVEEPAGWEMNKQRNRSGGGFLGTAKRKAALHRSSNQPTGAPPASSRAFIGHVAGGAPGGGVPHIPKPAPAPIAQAAPMDANMPLDPASFSDVGGHDDDVDSRIADRLFRARFEQEEAGESPMDATVEKVVAAKVPAERRKDEAKELEKEVTDGKADLARRATTKAPGSPYLVKLATFARELEVQARSASDAMTLRLLRQRLVEWVEDLRSVGSNDALADAVDQLVQRLSTALANAAPNAAAIDATELLAIAGELAALAAGAPPPPPRKKSRLAFWK